MTQTNTDKAVSTERLALAEEIIKRWAQWIVHVSADMDEPEWPTASAYSVANDRDFVLSVLSASRTQEPAEWPTDEQIWAAHDKLWEKRTAGQFAAVRDALLAASITPPAPERSEEETGVRIKPLEWPDAIRRGQRVMSGRGLIQYTICHYGGSEPDSGVVYRWAAAGEGWHGPLFSYEDAIAAAQADYEQRIKSALEPASLHKGEVPHLWGVQYSDNNRVDPHNVFLTEGSAMMRAMEAAIPAKVVPLFLRASPVPVPVTITDAARDVLAERKRQVEKEGWTPEHDDEHSGGEMARAAACYALGPHLPTHEMDGPGSYVVPDYWPWGGEWWKPKDRRTDLVRAGALILAEIERLDRAAHSVKPGEQG